MKLIRLSGTGNIELVTTVRRRLGKGSNIRKKEGEDTGRIHLKRREEDKGSDPRNKEMEERDKYSNTLNKKVENPCKKEEGERLDPCKKEEGGGVVCRLK